MRAPAASMTSSGPDIAMARELAELEDGDWGQLVSERADVERVAKGEGALSGRREELKQIQMGFGAWLRADAEPKEHARYGAKPLTDEVEAVEFDGFASAKEWPSDQAWLRDIEVRVIVVDRQQGGARPFPRLVECTGESRATLIQCR
ncbi:MAG: hypothetical protein U0414_11255 [Polyangiaceae bacterium]